METILFIALAAFATYLFYTLRQMKNLTDQLREREQREHVYYMRVIISDKNPQDLYAQPYHPVRGSMVVTSKPSDLAEKINRHFEIKEHQNVFIEHVQALN